MKTKSKPLTKEFFANCGRKTQRKLKAKYSPEELKAMRRKAGKTGARRRWSKPRTGVCRICGCTETTPCSLPDNEPCAWASGSVLSKTLCTNPKCLKKAAGR